VSNTPEKAHFLRFWPISRYNLTFVSTEKKTLQT
jgi:hypothetical protein